MCFVLLFNSVFIGRRIFLISPVKFELSHVLYWEVKAKEFYMLLYKEADRTLSNSPLDYTRHDHIWQLLLFVCVIFLWQLLKYTCFTLIKTTALQMLSEFHIFGEIRKNWHCFLMLEQSGKPQIQVASTDNSAFTLWWILGKNAMAIQKPELKSILFVNVILNNDRNV